MTKQEVLDYLDNVLHPIVSPDNWNVYSELHDMIEELPSAETVRHGKWIETEENHGFDNEVRNKALSCSVCRVAFRISDYAQIEDFRFCPNCGARMDEE